MPDSSVGCIWVTFGPLCPVAFGTCLQPILLVILLLFNALGSHVYGYTAHLLPALFSARYSMVSLLYSVLLFGLVHVTIVPSTLSMFVCSELKAEPDLQIPTEQPAAPQEEEEEDQAQPKTNKQIKRAMNVRDDEEPTEHRVSACTK